MTFHADIDLDLPDRKAVMDLIQCVPARQTVDGQIRNHNSGVYVNRIPYDPVNNCAAIDYVEAEQRGYIKLDFLNMNVYKLIESPEHYESLLTQETDWSKLWLDSEWAKQLVHVGNYTELLKTMRPDSIQRMAAFISIIRPGKAHLQNRPWAEVFASVWDGDTGRGYTFKKSHAIGYAMLVRLHMNLLSSTPLSSQE